MSQFIYHTTKSFICNFYLYAFNFKPIPLKTKQAIKLQLENIQKKGEREKNYLIYKT